MVETRTRPSVATGGGYTHGWSLIGLCVAVAAVSLLLPAALSFDPWAWLVWGRETANLSLDTTGGPSWKPLPVMVTTVLAPFGTLAAPLWMVFARAGALLALVGAYRLASRFAGRPAGVIAAALLVLTPDGDPRFLRLLGEGHVAPLSAAFALFAVDQHLRGRPSRALGLGWCAALLRPEAWPFLGLYALWMWVRHPGRRRLIAVVMVSIPVLWFGADWWGSGDALHGADAAQVADGEPVIDRLVEALGVAVAMVPAPAWFAAAAALYSASRRRERTPWWFLVGAFTWSALVIVMAAAMGYAALSRFHLPAAALICVLAGVGTVRVVLALRRRGHTVVAGVLVAASVALMVPRAAGVVPVLDEVAERGTVEDDLDRIIDQVGGRETLASCGEIAVEGTGLLRTAVAWKLDVPLHRTPRHLSDRSGTFLLRAGGRRDRTLSAVPHAVEIARTSEWVAYAARCTSALPHS